MSEVSKPIKTNQIDSLMSENAALSAKTDAAESNILAAAEERLQDVEDGLHEIRPDVDVDDDAARKYMNLILERGHLERVISTAKRRAPQPKKED